MRDDGRRFSSQQGADRRQSGADVGGRSGTYAREASVAQPVGTTSQGDRVDEAARAPPQPVAEDRGAGAPVEQQQQQQQQPTAGGVTQTRASSERITRSQQPPLTTDRSVGQI